MNIIKKQLALISTFAVIPFVTFAAITNPINAPTLAVLLERIIRIVIMIATPIVVLAVIYSGFLFVTAGGSEQKITLAKQVLFWTLVGALILLGAQVIATGVQGTVDSISDNQN